MRGDASRETKRENRAELRGRDAIEWRSWNMTHPLTPIDE
jgi:hypothetical protein